MGNILFEKSKIFAIKIINLCNGLRYESKENNISNQLFRSGTSIGANIAESIYASSKADFSNKLKIALKEASETKYWLFLLLETKYITSESFEKINSDLEELIKMLTSSINTSSKQE